MTESSLPQKFRPELSVVLVRPIYPRNIGMCARALTNMGGGDFICIAPQCELNDQAKEGAAGAQEMLRKVRVYSCFEDFFAKEPEGIRIALSARDLRSKSAEFLDVRMGEIVARETLEFSRIYLVFGPEDDGLSHSDLSLFHHVCRLPTYGEFTSLNISHAVLLACYIFSSHFSNFQKPSLVVSEDRRRPQFFPQKSIHNWLEALGFKLENRYVNAEKTLCRILLENEPTYEELKVLEAVLQQNIRKLRLKDSV